MCREGSDRSRFRASMEVTSVTGRRLRRGSVSRISVWVHLDRRVPRVCRAVTELQEVQDCLVGEDCLEFLARTVTQALRAVTERTACQEREVCLGRTDWTESRDHLELRGCPDLRGLQELPGPGEGLETKERLDLQDLWGHLDLLALMVAMDLLAQRDPRG